MHALSGDVGGTSAGVEGGDHGGGDVDAAHGGEVGEEGLRGVSWVLGFW